MEGMDATLDYVNDMESVQVTQRTLSHGKPLPHWGNLPTYIQIWVYSNRQYTTVLRKWVVPGLEK